MFEFLLCYSGEVFEFLLCHSGDIHFFDIRGSSDLAISTYIVMFHCKHDTCRHYLML